MEEVPAIVLETDELEPQEEPFAYASFRFPGNQIFAKSIKTQSF